jgi:hypothetical protein
VFENCRFCGAQCLLCGSQPASFPVTGQQAHARLSIPLPTAVPLPPLPCSLLASALPALPAAFLLRRENSTLARQGTTQGSEQTRKKGVLRVRQACERGGRAVGEPRSSFPVPQMGRPFGTQERHTQRIQQRAQAQGNQAHKHTWSARSLNACHTLCFPGHMILAHIQPLHCPRFSLRRCSTNYPLQTVSEGSSGASGNSASDPSNRRRGRVLACFACLYLK